MWMSVEQLLHPFVHEMVRYRFLVRAGRMTVEQCDAERERLYREWDREFDESTCMYNIILEEEETRLREHIREQVRRCLEKDATKELA